MKIFLLIIDIGLIGFAGYYAYKGDYSQACWYLLLSQLPFQKRNNE